jgi:hypothetical protein
MANLVPSGIDITTGQSQKVSSADNLVNSSGTPLAVGGLQLIERKEFLSDTASYTFTGLDGDTDEEYVIQGSVMHGTGAGNHQVYVRPNGLSTNLSGFYGQLAGAVYSGGPLTGWWLAVTTTSGLDLPAHVDAHVYAKRTGGGPNRQRMFRNNMVLAAPLLVNGTWNETVTNITSLQIIATIGVIGVGTELSLYKVIK